MARGLGRRVAGMLFGVMLGGAGVPAYAGTVGYWRFESDTDAGANTLSSPNEVTGNAAGSSSAAIIADPALPWVPGIGAVNAGSVDGLANLNGTVVSYASLDVASITVEFWAHSTEGTADLVTRTDGSSAGFVITDVNSVDVTYYVDDGLGGSQAITINTGLNLDTPWVHVAWTYDAVTGIGSVWSNGIRVGVQATPTPGMSLIWTGAGNLKVGTDMDGGGSLITGHGLIDEVRISDVALAPAQMLNAPLQVDFGANMPQDVQAGFYEFSAGATGNNSPNINGPVTNAYASPLSAGGTVTVIADSENTANTLDFRDRGDVTTGAVGDLIEDHIKNQQGGVRLTLQGLEAGQYEMTSWHHDGGGGAAGNLIDVIVDDALGSGRLLVDDLTVTGGLTPTSVASATFLFWADGANDVVILFDDANAAGNTDRETPVNGFILVQIPEPMTPAMLGFGLLAVRLLRRRLR